MKSILVNTAAVVLMLTMALAPTVKADFEFDVEASNARFSDEYEPYYPMITATTKTTEEIYEALCSNAKGSDQWSDTLHKTRIDVVKMYQDVGIDIAWGYGGEDYDGTRVQMRCEADKPSRWSKKTPKPLEGDYEQCFSIDACWNNKIPDDFPKVELTQEAFHLTTWQLATVKSNVSTGTGTGIPVIIGKNTDPIKTILDKPELYEPRKFFEFRMPENVSDYLINNTDSDQHAIFIDDEKKIGIHTWHTAPANAWYPYDFMKGAWPGYDIRTDCGSNIYELDGIGYYGRAGVYSVQVPALGFMIRPHEIADPDASINHALGGAFNPLFTGVVYPATRNDARGAGRGIANIGAVPQGGIVRLDPDFDLEAVYNSGKISLPLYKILKAIQDYGLYNLDTGGISKRHGLLMYSSTSMDDWINSTDARYNVPVMDNAQGVDAITAELIKFLDNDPFFGMSERPKLYVTIPNVKYAILDINDDGIIDRKDEALVNANIDKEITEENSMCDVNDDGQITGRDAQIYYNYFNDLGQHNFKYYTINYKDLNNEEGSIVCSADFISESQHNGIRILEGAIVSVGAVPKVGYEFVGWTGDFEGETSQSVVINMDKDYVIGAKFRKRLDMCKLKINTEGNGNVYVTTNGRTYLENAGEYGKETLLGLLAKPATGYEFVGWKGDIEGIYGNASYVINDDTEITAMFRQEGYTEQYKDDEWKSINGNRFISMSADDKSILFSADNFAKSSTVVNDKLILEDGYEYCVRVNNTVPLGNGNAGQIVFNYKDNKNYYFFKMGGKGGAVTLGKVYKGIKSTLRTYVKSYVSDDGVSFTTLPIDIKITRTKDGYITVEGFRDNSRIVYFDRVKDTSLKGGKIGVGSLAHGYLKMENISVRSIEENTN